MIAVITAPMSTVVFGLLLMIRKPRPLTLLPPTAAMSGLMTLLLKAVTTAVNAAPMATATARSTTLPRMMKFLNPWITAGLLGQSATLPPGTLGPGQSYCHVIGRVPAAAASRWASAGGTEITTTPASP